MSSTTRCRSVRMLAKVVNLDVEHSPIDGATDDACTSGSETIFGKMVTMSIFTLGPVSSLPRRTCRRARHDR